MTTKHDFTSMCFSQTALHHAARNGHLRCLKVLVDAGAKVDVKNNEGKTALQVALEKGEYESAKYLKTVEGTKCFSLQNNNDNNNNTGNCNNNNNSYCNNNNLILYKWGMSQPSGLGF